MSLKNIPWDNEQDKILSLLWERSDIFKEDIIKVFPDRTWPAIKAHASDMGLSSYSNRFKAKIDYEYLKKLGVVIEG